MTFMEEMEAFKPNARILFQGDSVTDGNRGRNADPNHILGHGYVFLIGSKFGSGFPERSLTFINRGVIGNKVTDLQRRWAKDTINLKPDLVSILVGVNDTLSTLQGANGVSVEQYEAVYDQLLQDTIAALPGVKLVLCEPFVLPVGIVKDRWEDWHPDVQQRQAVVGKLAAKYCTPVVHFQKMFDDACQRAPANYWIWDGAHPTYSGHQLMANEWVRVVDQFWKDGNKLL
jgi:lysophospholipase L1-like esterase